jgi:hypothetical protein
MATYHGLGRSNYFAVKDVAALKEALSETSITIEEEPQHGEGVVVLINDSGDSGDWQFWNDATDEDIYVPDMIAEHLQPGETAILFHIGNEKMRFLNGHAVAVRSDGRQIDIRLSDIYDAAAQEFGIDRATISEAEY